MSDAQSILSSLHRSFSDAISVRPVPAGVAINSPFFDGSGDHIAFYARDTEDGIILEDDGDFLPHLIASGIDIETGQRRQLLDNLLAEAGAYWDTETFEIRSHSIPLEHVGAASVRFLSGLLRIRTIESLTKENIRSTFKEDAIEAIRKSLSDTFEMAERSALEAELSEFPADIVLISRQTIGKKIGLFLVNSSTQFLEAELLHTEIERIRKENTLSTIALIEDTRKLSIIGERRFQRAINRGLQTRFFRDDELQAVNSLRKLAA
ncbi:MULTISPECIES: DUF1828 domain-containing protein [unclassified Neorhizobium]|uniref:DUF1828 domain-containing protein n=1 Tax=unclassified Neorhizobium TaxID=2629175 RepID=UPI001FF364FD|nr:MULTISPECIES: DUF1828 domain-containing protein [unclassified Neorhizobium]MCJ9673652.1 DUF1828 domain-containing protein [Neorhizobium sp. SHOUNA12B]MCJ9747522.1 DUF1828 domain-containing protein [Neorhizobium sp. SHOUNA12A]